MASKLTLLAALLVSACSGSLIDHLGESAVACPENVSACGPTCSACAIIPNSQVSCLNSNCNYTGPDGGTGCPLPSLAYPNGCATPGAVAAGGDTTCAIVGGAVECWGLVPGGAKSILPVVVPVLTSASQLAVGGGHACAVQNHQLFCWGANESGQTGQPASAAIANPTLVPGVDSPVAFATGGRHTCALTSGGVFCWGNNDSGQLGDAGGSRSTPQLVAGTSNAATVSAGSAHTCMGTSSGASCWGAGAQGQIGNGSTASVSSPKPVTFKGGGGNASALTIASGEQHNCAIDNGAVQCWGAGTQGQLGDGSIGNQSVAQKLDLLAPVKLAAGGLHTCATSGGGTPTGEEDGAGTTAGLYCWGNNDSGQLGTGGTGAPVLAPQLSPISTLAQTPSAVAAGTSHTCALLPPGNLLCWGANGNGQLGINSTQTSIGLPTQIVSAAK